MVGYSEVIQNIDLSYRRVIEQRRLGYQRALNSTQVSEIIDAGAYFARDIKGTDLIQVRRERFEFQSVIKNRYEQWITKIQSHRVSWSIKSERWSSVRVDYRTCAQKQLVLGKQIGQFRSRRINHLRPG